MPKTTRAPEITGLLEVLMGKLEKDRAAVTVRQFGWINTVSWSFVRDKAVCADMQAGEGPGSSYSAQIAPGL